LKKCATFLGVGLHLYGKRTASATSRWVPGQREDRGRGGGAAGRSTGQPPAPPSQPAASGNGQERAAQAAAPEQRGGADGPPAPSGRQTPHASASPQAGDGRLDNAQHTAILALAKKRRLSQLELNEAAVKRYGVQVPYLTYRDAAHFIRELQSLG
ncbi:MAG: hypothetical protein L0214_11060, partial [candidate division NC10 bacterium]|nr:hypothetical protein [candidate division NC10 bacterium]